MVHNSKKKRRNLKAPSSARVSSTLVCSLKQIQYGPYLQMTNFWNFLNSSFLAAACLCARIVIILNAIMGIIFYKSKFFNN